MWEKGGSGGQSASVKGRRPCWEAIDGSEPPLASDQPPTAVVCAI